MDNITSKEKAKELINKAYDLDKHNKTPQKTCKKIALLVVKEIIIELNKRPSKDLSDLHYWTNVEHEITQLKY